MISYNQIIKLHLEISSFCNARCPLCPRNFMGYPHNFGYTESNLTLSLIKQRILIPFIQQLRIVYINGNFGDFVMNPEALDFVEYFRSANDKLILSISTNGSARSSDFWKTLASYNPRVQFCLDGLEDTHHLYRQDTQWAKIISNANVFIQAGGRAVWKMIKFDHNQHQVEACKELSKQLGFADFELIDGPRNTGIVFDRNGSYSHRLGNPNWFADDAQQLILQQKDDISEQALEDLMHYDKNTIPDCKIKNNNSGVYISSEAKVYPCCWLGFNPETYMGWGKTFENIQIRQLMHKNDLHDYSFEETIEWFKLVESSWLLNNYSKGRMLTCDKNCGKKKVTEVAN